MPGQTESGGVPVRTAARHQAVELLRHAVGYALGTAQAVTPALLDRPTPCAEWDLRRLMSHLDDSLAALHEGIADGAVALHPPGGGTAPRPGGHGAREGTVPYPPGPTPASGAGPAATTSDGGPATAPGTGRGTGTGTGFRIGTGPDSTGGPQTGPTDGTGRGTGAGAGPTTGAGTTSGTRTATGQEAVAAHTTHTHGVGGPHGIAGDNTADEVRRVHGADPAGVFRRRAARLLGAWAAAPGRELLTVADAPLTATALALTGAVELAVHGWDIAQATGRPDRPVPAPLAARLLPVARQLVPHEGARPPLFAPEVPVPRDAPPGDRLLAFLGRVP
ncbi:hypothetical protein SALCHL_002636 [Streptomyces albus subsp. chlorinus]|uniref:hypothetical protein n=1 Tax=Streptomyces albus TaxID=1888 RepID=UPI0015702706|nr:hypothetical protein [Streptomyces albus]